MGAPERVNKVVYALIFSGFDILCTRLNSSGPWPARSKKGGRNLGVGEYHDVFEVGDGGFCNVETAVHDPNRFARRIQTGQKFMINIIGALC